MKKVVMCGGGTAGHVYPALAVSEKLNGFEIHFFGGNGMEKEILKNFPSITYHQIPTAKLERKLTPKNLLLLLKLQKSVKITKKTLKKLAPSVIFSKGGYVSVPVVLAAKKLKIPIVSHESDLTFGLANRVILRKCNVMCTSFEKTATSKKCVYTGQPIREGILRGKKLELGFQKSRPTILVLGGSLGAKFLNDIVFNNLDKLLEKYNILHICGRKNYDFNIKNNKKTQKNGYFLIDYAKNIQDYYFSADMVISRAGSGVINELLALRKPMFLIPLSKKISRGDQIQNAKYFHEKGYCEMIQEEEFTFEKMMQKLDNLQKNASKMQNNMKKTSKNNASQKIASIITDLASIK